jgi:hypothetical protein
MFPAGHAAPAGARIRARFVIGIVAPTVPSPAPYVASKDVSETAEWN